MKPSSNLVQFGWIPKLTPSSEEGHMSTVRRHCIILFFFSFTYMHKYFWFIFFYTYPIFHLWYYDAVTWRKWWDGPSLVMRWCRNNGDRSCVAGLWVWLSLFSYVMFILNIHQVYSCYLVVFHLLWTSNFHLFSFVLSFNGLIEG